MLPGNAEIHPKLDRSQTSQRDEPVKDTVGLEPSPAAHARHGIASTPHVTVSHRAGRSDAEHDLHAASPPAGHGDVRPRRRHVADERLDLIGGPRPGHDRERRPVGDRARGARLGGVHPDRQQDRRSDRAQASVRAGSARLRRRRALDGARPEPGHDRHLLGHRGWARRLAAAARHAVPDPRQLRGDRSAQGLRAGRGGGGDRGRGRTADRRLHHDLPLVARGLPHGGRRHRDRALRHPAGARRPVHGSPWRRRGGSGPVRARHGRHRAGHPRVAGGRGVRRGAPGDRRRRAGGARLVAHGAARVADRHP